VATQHAKPALTTLNRPYQGAGAGSPIAPQNVPITKNTNANTSNTVLVMTKPPKDHTKDDSKPEEVAEQDSSVPLPQGPHTLADLIERFGRKQPGKKEPKK
jgi:hypothetical protein